MNDDITVLLERFAWTPMGVFGRLMIPEFECFTVERPWRNNIPQESCIPLGTYDLRLGRYNRGGYPAYELIDVPNRSLIKIHRGNTSTDVIGCIALGQRLGWINGQWAVTGSRRAFDDFMSAMDNVPHSRIQIRPAQIDPA